MAVDPPVTSGDPPRVAYTPQEVATRLGWKYRRVLRAIHRGDLRARPDGPRCYVVPVAALDEYLRATG